MKTLSFIVAAIMVILIFNLIMLPAFKENASRMEEQAIAQQHITCKSDKKNSNRKLYWLKKQDLYLTEQQATASTWQCYDRNTNELLWEKTGVQKLDIFEEREVILEYKSSLDTNSIQTIGSIDIKTGKTLWTQPAKRLSNSTVTVDISRNTIFIEEVSSQNEVEDYSKKTIWSIYHLDAGEELFYQIFDSTVRDNTIMKKSEPHSDFFQKESLEYYSNYAIFYDKNDSIPFTKVKGVDTVLDTKNYWLVKEKVSNRRMKITSCAKYPSVERETSKRMSDKLEHIAENGEEIFISRFEFFNDDGYHCGYYFYPLAALDTVYIQHAYKSLPIKKNRFNYHAVDIKGKQRWMFVQDMGLIQIKEMKNRSKVKKMSINSRKPILKIMEQEGFFYCYIQEKHPTAYSPNISIAKYKVPVNFESQ